MKRFLRIAYLSVVVLVCIVLIIIACALALYWAMGEPLK